MANELVDGRKLGVEKVMDGFCPQNAPLDIQRWSRPGAPYQGLWQLQTFEAQVHLRLVPDLQVHLIFDLAGTVATEPLFLWCADQWVDLTIPAKTHWLGLAIDGWSGSGLHQTQDDVLCEPWSKPTPRLVLDGWSEALYFELLEAKNHSAQLEQPLGWFHHSMLSHLEAQPVPEARVLSARQQRRLYASRLALRPNVIERIGRFRRVLQALRTKSATHLDHYADQAHWIRECRRFSGSTPSQLQRLQRL